MAQTGYTPILLYATATASTVPTAANLTSTPTGAELAINYTDGKLYYKDNTGTVQLIASKAAASISLPLSAANGGTGESGTITGLLYGNGTSAATQATAAQIVAAIGTTGVVNSTYASAVSNSGGWSITPTGTKLYFNYNGTNVASLDSSGNFIAKANVTAAGTP